jgi:hypothetical protein
LAEWSGAEIKTLKVFKNDLLSNCIPSWFERQRRREEQTGDNVIKTFFIVTGQEAK